jgi:hypothetical protein
MVDEAAGIRGMLARVDKLDENGVRRMNCSYETEYVFDVDGSLLAFCGNSDEDETCGWIERVTSDSVPQTSGAVLWTYTQLQELHFRHRKTAMRNE